MQTMIRADHSLGTSARLVRVLAAPAASSPDLSGRTIQHKILVIAHYNEDTKSPMLSIADLTLEKQGNNLSTQLEFIATYKTPGVSTDIHVSPDGQGNAHLAVATSQGSALVLKLTIPTGPGGGPEDLNFLENSIDPQDPQLFQPQYIGLHTSSTASVDINPATKSLLTVGEDGCITVTSLGEAGKASTLGQTLGVRNSWHGTAAYTKAKWIDSADFITADVFGGVSTWDTRALMRPKNTMPRLRTSDGHVNGVTDHVSSSSGGKCCWWVDCHPSRAYLACTGEAGARVAIWDTRMSAQPLVGYVADDPGDVWQVQMDLLQSGQQNGSSESSPVPGLLFCTEGGTLGFARQATVPIYRNANGSIVSSQALETIPFVASDFAINSFDTMNSGREVVAVASNNTLIYIDRQPEPLY